MSIPKQTFFRYIREFKLKELFNELGWDNIKLSYPIKVKDHVHTLTGVAEKKGFVIFLCATDGSQGIPDSAARKKIDNAVARLHHEHLIIYIDSKKNQQHWELLIREQNKPVVSRPVDYYAGQEPELLFQKLEGLFFTFEDEEKLSIVDVRSRVMANFEKNAEVVTKKFYERFEKEHDKFLGFIEGIESKVDREWYASLMLNRLMFIYFIQKKGFLDHDKNYLRNRLKVVQQKKGKNKFYSFYKNFMLVLFHKGLGSPIRDPELEAEIGKTPYLNGGLFDVHKLEHENEEISIEDKAFERIFDFFDEYNWHLDTRITSSGKDINPDVIGYIFEKYINDRASMGAFYTKEDITEYISKNCIFPWLVDEVKRSYAKPFAKDGTIWTMLKESGDKYIYPAVKHGVVPNSTEENGFTDLPEDVQSCIDPNTPDLVEKRKCWNRPAPSVIGLPTEIYREVIARRKRFYEVRRKICAEGASASGGEAAGITEINDFITYNLDIRQFVQDLLTETDDPKLIMEFYKAVRKITVLDPTCGSGAFLFAALNVLEPLYFACVIRMREFVEEQGKGKHKFFEDELKLIDAPEHPSTEYFIYKSIILHNLYGVDIMKEAVEIAKLRLFLKLVATCDVDYAKPNLGLEPLPDIDFNIRSGNTLVGYATLADLDKSEQGGLFGDEEKQAILEEADIVGRAYDRFKDAQLVMHSDPKTYKAAKDELNNRLIVLNDKLNKHLAVTYLGPTHGKTTYDKWLTSHQPFHWLAEYYTTIAPGGFDVIIGNPPYVETKDVTNYTAKGYSTEPCGDLYALILERALSFSKRLGHVGFIVPLSSFSVEGFLPLQKLYLQETSPLFVSSWSGDAHPGKLFEGVNKRLAILIAEHSPSEEPVVFSSNYLKWYSEERSTLFAENPSYQRIDSLASSKFFKGSLPKVCSSHDISVIEKLKLQDQVIGSLVRETGNSPIHYTRKVSFFLQFLNFVPEVRDSKGVSRSPSELKTLKFADELSRNFCLGALSSSLFYWFNIINSDCRNLNKREIVSFPIPAISGRSSAEEMKRILQRLMKDYKDNSDLRTVSYSEKGNITVQYFNFRPSKPIIDEIDKVLAKHYGFTEEELDFIINYDIKYRMGKELGGE